eukprot:12285173-Karenia_brevis.AAC.1
MELASHRNNSDEIEAAIMASHRPLSKELNTKYMYMYVHSMPYDDHADDDDDDDDDDAARRMELASQKNSKRVNAAIMKSHRALPTEH